MILLVVRSVAVYALTAGVFLWLANRFVGPLTRGAAVVIAIAPFLLTGRATLTGSVYAPLDIAYQANPLHSLRQSMGIGQPRSAILGDVVYEEIPWRKAVRAAVKRGELPLWNPDILAGEPLLAVQQPAVFHPATWIGFLLPLAQAWTFEMSFRLFLALLCAYLFLKDLGCRPIPALVGAAGWAFSNYLVFFLGYPLSPAAAPFPLLLLGLRRLARGPGRRGVAILVIALLLIVTSGHPESVLHTVAAAGLFFLFELSRARRGDGKRAVLHAFGAGVLTLGISAILLLPLAEALPNTLEHAARTSWYVHQDRSVPWRGVVERLALEASPLAVSRGVHPERNEAPFGPSGYCGSVLLPLAFTGLFARCRSRWFFMGLLLLGLSIGTSTPVANALARLPLFDIALNERLIFLAAFSVCVLAALGSNRLLDGEGVPAFLAGSAATLAGLAWLFGRYEPTLASLGIPPAEALERFLVQTIPVLAAAVIVVVLSRERRARIGLAALLLILLVQRQLEAGSLYPTAPSRAFYPPLSVLAKIPRGEPYRFASLSYTFIPNVAVLYGLEDVRGYEAMTFRPLWETYPLWCTHQPVWYNRVDDPTKPFLSFLNVRWVLSPVGMASPRGWPVVAEDEGMRLVENPHVLARAFAPRLVLAEPDPARRLAALATVGDFAVRGVVSERGSGEWVANGEATVTIAQYAADRLALEVDARETTLIGTSVTAWPGWKAELEGQPVPSVSYNHAFLAFRVPAGRHRLVLRYLPDSIRVGAVVSLASCLLAFALLFRTKAAGSDPMAGETAEVDRA